MNTNLNQRDSAVVDAVMTLFNSVDKDTQSVLWVKINSAIKKSSASNKKIMTDEEASKFLDSLVVKGGEPVPPEEDGMNAFVEQKYRL